MMSKPLCPGCNQPMEARGGKGSTSPGYWVCSDCVRAYTRNRTGQMMPYPAGTQALQQAARYQPDPTDGLPF